jgi:hypothetical protein
MGGEERADKLFVASDDELAGCEARNAAGGAIHHAKIARRRKEQAGAPLSWTSEGGTCFRMRTSS